MKASPRLNSGPHQLLVVSRRHESSGAPVPLDKLGKSPPTTLGHVGKHLQEKLTRAGTIADSMRGSSPTSQIGGQDMEETSGRLHTLYFLIQVVLVSLQI